MNSIILSIKPQYVEMILKRQKRFEYRTKVAKKNINRILIYSTNPVMKVIAEVEVISVLTEPPKKLWERTKHSSGISKEYYEQYFHGRKVAYAYELGEINLFETPKRLIEYGCKFAPQSFMYLRTIRKL